MPVLAGRLVYDLIRLIDTFGSKDTRSSLDVMRIQLSRNFEKQQSQLEDKTSHEGKVILGKEPSQSLPSQRNGKKDNNPCPEPGRKQLI